MEIKGTKDNLPEVLGYTKVVIDGDTYYHRGNSYYKYEKKPTITNKTKGAQYELVCVFRKRVPTYKKKTPLRAMKMQISKHLKSRHLAWDDEPIYRQIMALLGIDQPNNSTPAPPPTPPAQQPN